jgi:hypothetical protein
MKQPRLGDAPFARSFKHEQAGLFGHTHPHFAFSSRILTMSAVLIKLHQVKSTSVPSCLTLKPKMFEQNQNPKLNPKKRTHMCCRCFFPCFFPMYPRVPLFFQVARSEGAGAAPIKISWTKNGGATAEKNGGSKPTEDGRDGWDGNVEGLKLLKKTEVVKSCDVENC